MTPTRKTFVVSVRDQDGPATVHEVRTGRKARLSSLAGITAQIERWLQEAKPRSRESQRRGEKR